MGLLSGRVGLILRADGALGPVYAAWKYVSGLDKFRSMKIPVHGFTVTPVVSLPQESVIVFVSSGSPMDFSTGSNAAAPIPAPVPAQTLTV